MHEEIRYKKWECDIIISVRTEFLVFGICITFDTTQYWTNFRTELFFCMLWMPLQNSHFRFTNKKYSLHDYYHLLIMYKVPNVLRKISCNIIFKCMTFVNILSLIQYLYIFLSFKKKPQIINEIIKWIWKKNQHAV